MLGGECDPGRVHRYARGEQEEHDLDQGWRLLLEEAK